MNNDTIRILDLGSVSPLRSQTVYHAVAYNLTEEAPDTIILVSPDKPYVCIGRHQNLEQEVDMAYCQQMGLPVYRREVGGGAVYLDDGQLFVQWVFKKENLPQKLEERFRVYIQPILETYQELGIKAYLRPVNDIHVDGKKIGGTGAAQIGLAEVLVGSFMFTFDKQTMARVLKVSSEKMRDKIYESLEQYMVTMADLMDPVADRALVKRLYLEKCQSVLKRTTSHGSWTEADERKALEIDAWFQDREWLYQKSGLAEPGIKIHQDVRVVESAFKAPGGLIRVVARIRENRIDDIVLSGDFTMLPVHALTAVEESLKGLECEPDSLMRSIEAVYHQMKVQSPGLEPEHFTQAIFQARSTI